MTRRPSRLVVRTPLLRRELDERYKPNPRTLRVFIAGWVIQDGSFPRASVGDAADVVLEHCSSADAPSIRDETRTATARPAYGRGPTRHRDGQLRWLHLLYGDGWSSQWWTDEPTHGPVTLTGIFSAGSGELNGIDTPPRVCGRITRMHLVHKQVEPMDNGWTGIAGTDRLTAIEMVPAAGNWSPTEKTQDGDFVESGVLLELDLDNVPTMPTPFVAGAVTLDGNTVWVMPSRIRSCFAFGLRAQRRSSPATFCRRRSSHRSTAGYVEYMPSTTGSGTRPSTTPTTAPLIPTGR
ncbi:MULTISPECIES: hypothetical protein [unclassified Rhodococcus (in: high G+C Gram-positive bacteria)]|uniref:hypothetical protein n=1 Tax=unclassified Rhodococcus (in: high G+C Gram-positive bacteria) TaxID=192944 RepID=UPI003394A3AB